MSNTIDALALKKAFIAGANNLDKNKEYINELNVFPVPDGDTGTNMTLTILSAVKEVEAAPDDMKSIAKAMSTGSLRGARGNSGVILSQLLRGFSKKVQDARTIDVHVIADAFQKAVETAYKAVMKPKEGTILTVAKGVASKARECADADMSLAQFCDEVIEYGDAVLDSTPEMLPVLKEAGVVDSGGQGLMVVLKGAVDCLMGRVTVELSKNTGTVNVARTSTGAGNDSLSTADIKFGYCTEFIINLEKPYGEAEEDDLKSFLESIGDSIVCVSLDDIVKIHVHTNHPGQAFEKGLTLGYLTNMKIDNMRIEHHERVIGQAERDEAEKQEEERQHRKQEHKEPRKKYGFITVSMGDGLKTLFEELGADRVIEGGQTMNPSTEDMLAAIDHVNADHIFILPNNKNIIMAANQAAELTEDKDIIVLPTKTIPQGIVALVNYIPDYTAEENKEAMLAELDSVKTGQVTYAVRDTEIDGMQIRQNDYMGIGDKAILAVGTDLKETTMKMIDAMVDEDSAIVSIYYGADETEEHAQEIGKMIEEKYPDVEVEINCGGQPIYYFVISVE